MRAGSLTEPIEIQEFKITENAYGEKDKYLETVISTKAEVKYKSGARLIENSEIFISYTLDFYVRIYHNITESMQIKYNGNSYRILAIEANKHKQFKILHTEIINE